MSDRQFQIRKAPIDEFAKIKVLCIGAGISGILSGIKLPQKIENLELEIYEKSGDIGGTWLDNHYPGIACDIPTAAYYLSFDSYPGWSRYYAPGGEILEYWKRVAEKYDVYKYITFNAEVIEARWNEEDGVWAVQLGDRRTGRIWSDSGNVLISATGILNKWVWPEIPGLSDFKGHKVHTANLDDSYDVTGKNVALIGGGSSGIQLLPQIQPKVAHCDHYMKGRTWIACREPGSEVPGMNPEKLEDFDHTKEDLDKWANDPEEYLRYRCAVEDALNSGTDFIVNGTELQKQAHALFDEKMKTRLAKKPEVYDALIPDFPPGCRRLTHGKHRAVDAIICATGFDTSLKPRFPTYGLGCITLGEVWDPTPEAYLSMCPAKMPNYFLYLGPNGGPGTGSTIILLEQVAEYICKSVAKLQREGLKKKNQFVNLANTSTRIVYGLGCRSWFKRGQEDGRVVFIFPGGSMSALQAFEHPRWEDFEWTRAETSDTSLNMWAWLGDGTTKAQNAGTTTSGYLRNLMFRPKVPVKSGRMEDAKGLGLEDVDTGRIMNEEGRSGEVADVKRQEVSSIKGEREGKSNATLDHVEAENGLEAKIGLVADTVA